MFLSWDIIVHCIAVHTANLLEPKSAWSLRIPFRQLFVGLYAITIVQINVLINKLN